MWKYLKEIENISKNNIPDLDTIVLASLEKLSEEEISLGDLDFKKALVVWSWNAKHTASIIHQNSDYLFADENNYKENLEKDWVDWVIIYSASGAKHAPIVAKYAKDKWFEIKLITCKNNSETEKIIGKENCIITPKIKEPYTYNTSTYMWWIIANTWENPKEILNIIENDISKQIERQNFYEYDWFLFAIPNKFAKLSSMIDVKFIELFGRNISRDIKTYEELKHAITVVPNKKELCIKFWQWEVYFENDVLTITLPENLGLAGFMAISYYIVWKIQRQMPPYFKDNIENYINALNKSWFTKNLEVIVE